MTSSPAISTSLSRPTPFGSDIKTRGYSAGRYRFGFNGKEEDGETVADAYYFGARIYDARLGRWLAVDPCLNLYVSFSPYNYALNDVIRLSDSKGDFVKDKEGRIVFVSSSKGKEAKWTTSQEQPGSRVYESGNENSEAKKENHSYTMYQYEGIDGYIFTDDGKKVPAILVLNSKVVKMKVTKTWNNVLNQWDVQTVELDDNASKQEVAQFDATTNCTGHALLDGKFVVFSNKITNEVLRGENMRKLNPEAQPQVGDIGVYRDKTSNIVEHFVKYSAPKLVCTKGGVTQEKVDVAAESGEIWKSIDIIYEVWRKVQDARTIDIQDLGSCEINGVHFLDKKDGKEFARRLKSEIKSAKKTKESN